MTHCEKLTDRMFLVAQGGSDWSAEEAAHLASCADCGAEWRLVQAAQGLGALAASRIDPARVSRAGAGPACGSATLAADRLGEPPRGRSDGGNSCLDDTAE